jgi:hypothetical protein
MNQPSESLASLEHELQYWGNCTNTYCEETKQFVYAELMGFEVFDYQVNANNCSVIDIGGGPSSLLLKTINLKRGLVVDPISYPAWTRARYEAKGIQVAVCSGEDIQINNESKICLPCHLNTHEKFDEVWIYNCLQHVIDPELILFNARRSAKRLRIAEWINCPSDEMHPWCLTETSLVKWIGGLFNYEITDLNRSNCYGTMFHATVCF